MYSDTYPEDRDPRTDPCPECGEQWPDYFCEFCEGGGFVTAELARHHAEWSRERAEEAWTDGRHRGQYVPGGTREECYWATRVGMSLLWVVTREVEDDLGGRLYETTVERRGVAMTPTACVALSDEGALGYHLRLLAEMQAREDRRAA